jgi:hypothetical protein
MVLLLLLLLLLKKATRANCREKPNGGVKSRAKITIFLLLLLSLLAGGGNACKSD